jgi:dienelactone hydrolase
MKSVVALMMLLIGVAGAHAQNGPKSYTEVFYRSGSLRIQAYLYKPAGAGPFPAVVYNHGSRRLNARRSVPWIAIACVYTDAGFAVLVPERRGYGKSDGPAFGREVGRDLDLLFVRRLRDEADDVVAAAAYLETVPFVDAGRIGVAGHSFGGIVTVLAAARSDAFKVAVDLAGGSLTWKSSPALRRALVEAAEHTHGPMLLMVSKNDRTTDAITTLDQAMTAKGLPHQMKIYPPYTPPRRADVPDGHQLFMAPGAPIWGGDVTGFLRRYLD